MVVVRNWAGNVTFSTDLVHRPRTVEQLQELVATTRNVRALGTGHSFNRIADTPGELVSVRDLEVPIEVDEPARTVTVGGGVRYGELTVDLQKRGFALHNLGSLPHIAVAGACATGTHGSGSRNGCLSTAVVAVEFVNAAGELVRTTTDHDTFAGSVLALGAIGIATTLTLRIEPSYEVRQDVWLDLPLDTFLANLDAIMDSGYSVSAFSRWARGDVIDQLWIKSRSDGAIADGRQWGARAADGAQHPIAGQDPVTATQQLGVPGPWNARLPHFRLEFTPSNGEEQQSEFVVPRALAADAVAAVSKLGFDDVLQVCELRTIAADELWLSPFYGRDSLGLHFTWADDDARVAAAVARVETALAPFDARPHWGKVFQSDPRVHYPLLPRFRNLIDTHDPEHKFGNAFLDQFVY